MDVQPITAIHLHSNLEREPEELGSMSYIWIFSAVAFFMLLIACINYMNLTTARSARRAKEIGIRKVTGSTKKQLVLQFLSESLLTAFVAVLLSILLVILYYLLSIPFPVRHLQYKPCFSHLILFCFLAFCCLPDWWAAAIRHFIFPAFNRSVF